MAKRVRKPAPLKWVGHRLSPSSGNALRSLTDNVMKRMLRSALAAPVESAQQATISFPILPDAPRDKATRLLQAAAEVEHALMVQYLYAGNGFTTANRAILDIAIEEMSHLMTVQNLLRVIEQGPSLNRQDFGPPDNEDERLFPFDLLLEPITNVSLAKYVVAESPENLPPGVDPVVMSHVVDLATQGAGAPVNRVANLYALLGAVFGSEQLLMTKAATGDPWYLAVNNLAAEAAVFYGGRDKLHLPDGAFDSASTGRQGTDADWDRTVVKAIDEFRVHTVSSREEALEALRDIGLQGEGPSTVATEDSHFKRFFTLFTSFFGPDGLGTNPAPHVASVPAAPIIVVDVTSADPNAISHPDTVRWARLADLRYGILLGSLELFLNAAPGDREFLRGWCFAEMFAIRKLAQFLVTLPRSAAATIARAAIPFNLPAWAGAAATWDDLIAAFTASLALIVDIQAHGAGGSDQSRILDHLASADQRKLSESQARKAGNTARTKADRARDILDWAAGAGDPRSHGGTSPPVPLGNQGRFWNLPLADFKQTQIQGANIIEVPAGGGDPLLLEVLREGFMPAGPRPPLDVTAPEFLFLEAWIQQNCPDEPA